MNYSQMKKLDEDSSRDLKEGSGPVDECLCSMLAPSYEPKSLRGSIKKAFASIGGRRGGRNAGKGGTGARGGNTVEIPLTFEKGGRGIFTTKEEVKRATSCGKCGCDKEKFFLKHSYANIRITSPDVSSICPCSSSACMPGKDQLNNNISVTVEHVTISDSDAENKDDHKIVYKTKTNPVMDKTSTKELLDHVWKEWKNTEDRWSKNIEEETSEDTKTLDSRPEENDLDVLEDNLSTEENEKTTFTKSNSEI